MKKKQISEFMSYLGSRKVRKNGKLISRRQHMTEISQKALISRAKIKANAGKELSTD